MDPCEKNTVYDWSLLSAAIAASIPFILANGVIFWYRNRRYFESQGGVGLILVSSFAGIMWITSSFVVNSHFRRNHHRILQLCTLWTFWLHGTLGPCLWSSCITIRLYKILNLSRHRNFPTWKYWLYMLMSVVPALSLSTVAAALPDSYTFSPHISPSGNYKCGLTSRFKILIWFFFALPYFCLYVLLLIRLRGYKHTGDPILVMEYLHTQEYVSMTCVILVTTWITYFTKGHLHVAGRCFITFCECCLVFSHFWVRFGWPVYLCLFKPKSDMDSFEDELMNTRNRSSMELMQAVYSQRSQNVPSSEGAVFEAVAKATEEIQNYSMKIRELEQLRTSLQLRVNHLRRVQPLPT